VCVCGWDFLGTDYGYRERGAGFSIFINDIVAQIDFCQFCLNPEKSQAIVIGFPGFQLVSMGSTTIPFFTRVSLRLTINSRFSRVTITRLISSAAGFISRWNAYELLRPCCAIVFLRWCDFFQGAVGLRNRLRLAYNSCARYILGIRRSENTLGYFSRILVLPLGWYYSFRICYQMYRIVFILKSLHWILFIVDFP
jgi:hypothetical protein